MLMTRKSFLITIKVWQPKDSKKKSSDVFMEQGEREFSLQILILRANEISNKVDHCGNLSKKVLAYYILLLPLTSNRLKVSGSTSSPEQNNL
jgi:hypothetical protein